MKSIQLTRGKITFVDDDVYEWASKFKWYAVKDQRTFYAARKTSRKLGKRKTILLHREIMASSEGTEVDHEDGDGLNNVRGNLRSASHKQNAWAYRTPKVGASSKYRGVCWSSAHQQWVARIRVNGVRHHLGLFWIEDCAARAYDSAALKFFGEFACVNLKQA